MITASVGFQCPECAKAGARHSRTIDVATQRRQLDRPPAATMTLLAMNIVVFVLGAVMDRRLGLGFGGGDFEARWGSWDRAVAAGEWWRLITAGFIHFGIIHLGLNMYALYILGPTLERLLGQARFVLLYFVALMGGSLGSIILEPNALSAGASGAIFGIFGAYAVVELSRGVNPLRTDVGTTIMLNLVLTFTIGGISIGGHVGGLVAGSAGAAALLLGTPLPRQRNSEQAGRAAAVVALGLVCCAAAIQIARSRYGLG